MSDQSDKSHLVLEPAERAEAAQPRSSEPAVRADIRSFAFGARAVLQDLQLSVAPGEAVAVLGPSGCGKSTLIRVLANILPRGPGESLDGVISLAGTAPSEFRATGELSVMFQDPTLLPHLSVEQNIRLPAQLLGRDGEEDVDPLLKLVGLEAFRDYLPRDLSGGMRTRTALARSFVSKPKLLLLDEPFTGLDLGWRESLYGSLQRLRARNGTTILMVTHDLEEAVYNSDRVLVMSPEGTFVEKYLPSGSTPRDHRFGETVAHHTDILGKLARILGASPIETA